MVAFKTVLFTILVPGMVGGLIPWLLAHGGQESTPAVSPVWVVVGLLLVVLGVGLYLWCAGAVHVHRQGLYRWVRNPKYIAVLLVILSQALLFRSPLLVGYALLFWVVVHAFVVVVEEPSLRGQFGSSYDAYRRRVPRWIPRPPQA